MKKMTMYSLILILTLCINAFLLAPELFAEENSMPPGKRMREAVKERIEEREQEQKQMRKPTITAARCEKIQNRIQEKIANFEKTHQFHIKQYARMQKMLEDIIEKGAAEDKDVAVFESDLTEFINLKSKFEVDREAFLTALKNLQGYACEEGDGTFKEAVRAVQEKHKIVIADAAAIKNFYKDTVRAHLKELRDQ